MPLIKKTKQERESTPLGKSPDAITPVTDIKSALADINTRSAARQKSISDSSAKLNAARIERSKKKTPQSGGGGLHGLASFGSTYSRKQ